LGGQKHDEHWTPSPTGLIPAIKVKIRLPLPTSEACQHCCLHNPNHITTGYTHM
jgi:hypothetical protein